MVLLFAVVVGMEICTSFTDVPIVAAVSKVYIFFFLSEEELVPVARACIFTSLLYYCLTSKYFNFD